MAKRDPIPGALVDTLSDKVRIGVVGTSWWADAMYLPALTAHPLADVRGVVGARPARTRIFDGARRDVVTDTYKDTFRDHDVMARGFVTAIATGTPASPEFRDGLAVQRVVDAASRSAREGRRVMIAEIVAGEG